MYELYHKPQLPLKWEGSQIEPSSDVPEQVIGFLLLHNAAGLSSMLWPTLCRHWEVSFELCVAFHSESRHTHLMRIVPVELELEKIMT